MRYGAFNHPDFKSAHRFAWFLTHGQIPDGLFVLHTCDNPPCCNPSHLRLGTHAENMADKKAKGRSKHRTCLGSNHTNAKLTNEGAQMIRENTGRYTVSFLARAFKVSRITIGRIRSGHRYFTGQISPVEPDDRDGESHH